MSGICGILSFNPSAPVDGIDRVIRAAPWHGPDGTGVWRGEGSVLAHQALHVTPESRHEEQPLVDEEAGLVLVADARIDNRDELQRTLRRDLRRSVRRDVITDADLILAAYRRWGTDCAEHLLGDFAFAVWDQRRRQLFAARDPMAMRPFYYRIENGRVLFGSEVKQILAAPGVPREIFEPMVAMHLFRRFDRHEWTFFQGISRLNAGHLLVVNADGVQRLDRFWDLDLEKRISYSNQQAYVEHFRALFTEAVSCRLRSDKPAGLLLSGGLDSMSIAGAVGQLQAQKAMPRFHVISWAFDRFSQCDEREVSEPVARKYDFPSHHIQAENAWTLKDYPAHGPDVNDPFIGNYQVLIEQSVKKACDEGVRVLCTGARGDIMGGEYIFDYPSLFWSGRWKRLLEELQLQAKWRRQSLLETCKQFLVHPARHYIFLPKYVKRLYSLVRRLRNQGNQLTHASGAPWIQSSMRHLLPEKTPDPYSAATFPANYARWQRYQALTAPFNDQVATWQEWTYARQGCSFCDPWSDVRIAQFAYSIPQRVLNKTTSIKHLTRTALEGWVPEDSRKGARKVSPEPFYQWSMREQAPPVVRPLLSEMRASSRGYVREGALNDHFADAIKKGNSVGMAFWWTLTLEMWLRRLEEEGAADRLEESSTKR